MKENSFSLEKLGITQQTEHLFDHLGLEEDGLNENQPTINFTSQNALISKPSQLDSIMITRMV